MTVIPPESDDRAELSALCGKVPKRHATMNYVAVLDFKDALANAQRVCSNARSTAISIKKALQELRRFHQE